MTKKKTSGVINKKNPQVKIPKFQKNCIKIKRQTTEHTVRRRSTFLTKGIMG